MGLNRHNRIAATGVLCVALALPGSAQASPQFAACPAPIAHCVSRINGWCETDKGKLSVHFFLKNEGNGNEFRIPYAQCVREVLANRGRQGQKATPKR
jgi:hypothetical protein